jgi:hypothetical protein
MERKKLAYLIEATIRTAGQDSPVEADEERL